MTVAAPPRPGGARRWSLQTRLIVTVVSFVALILAAVGLATATTLRAIVEEGLDSEIKVAASQIRILPGQSAEQTLNVGRQQTGTLLILRTFDEPTGAYVDSDNRVIALTDDEVTEIIDAVARDGFTTVPVPHLGDYRVLQESYPSGAYAVLGRSASQQIATIARILTTVALLTVGGLLVLSAIIALVIRQSLKPLRSVADTATRVAAQRLDSGDVTITERVPDAEADASDEIGAVGAALNSLLDHVDSSLASRQRNEERMRAFVADASHELRTPLAAIRGYSELSLRSADADQSRQGLERIQAASLRMTTLVEDLLLLARLDEGKELVYGTVDLTRVVIDAIADAQAAGPEHAWELDAGEDPVVVAGDAVRLHQVIANLLTNARVHTPAGTRVSVSVAVSDGEAVVRVADDGPGIDPAVADELFERFARADTSRTRQTGGTGLGLSIAKAIVTAHHGTITVESRPGATVFEVRLPARPAAPAAPAS
ncbi:sensor histidine kinase [Microbacterium sp.]|uniref:sensor histidine kinase n=1 Tax=Microbacterium sp. TaxID=51671 RepID=UPI003C70D4C6